MKTLRIPLVIVLVALAGQAFNANAQTETNLYTFGSNPADGISPRGGLVQGSDGNFYGTTVFGSETSGGTVFRISPSGSETTLYNFFSVLNDGWSPFAGLVQGSDGSFYGTTLQNGEFSQCNDGCSNCPQGCGTVFRISPSDSYTNLYSFGDYPIEGSAPYAGLVQGSDGNFYGTAYDGGANDYGTVFRISPSGSYTTLYSFGGYFSADGIGPYAGLVQGSDGNFYGLTSQGGANGNWGTVFRISPSGNETNLHLFVGSPTDGSDPTAGLVLGSDGNFYGTTQYGGTYGSGTVFRISASGNYTNLYSFGSVPNDGYDPAAGLVQGSDGNFYGTTYYGGASTNCNTEYKTGCGTVFRISASGTYTSLYSFVGSSTDGAYPYAGLLQGSDGNFYGTTSQGGTNAMAYGGIGYGIVFKLDVGLGPIINNCPSSISSTNAAFGMAGGSGSVSMTASNECYWSAISTDSFITITSGFNGFGNGTVDFTVATNTHTSVQTGTINIGGKTFTVTQAAAACSVSPASTSADFGSAGGSDSVTITANGMNCFWTAVSNDSFITITSGSSGTGNGTVHYSVAVNSSTNGLTGTLAIAGQTFTVNQAGATPCTVTLNATSITLPAAGGAKTVTVKGTCAWTASSNDGFITITFGSSGNGNGTVHYSLAANTSTSERSGMITIADQIFTVNQDAGGCTYTLSPKNAKLKATGGSSTVKVTPNYTDCDWTAVSNNPFITITGGASGTGKGSISYTVASNTNTVALIGTMTIASEIFTVDEAAVTCEVALGETNATFSSSGGSSNVTVTANGTNCTWKAVAAGSFIHITSGASSVGDGTVDYTVEANTKTAARKGTITVSKEKLTITQSGAP